MTTLTTLKNDSWQIGVLPETGGSLAFGRVQTGKAWADFLRPTPETSFHDSMACGSYVLIPWSNRIRDGHFRFRDKDYQLRLNFPDGTAIHGCGKEFPWKVEAQSKTQIEMSFDSRNFYGVNFPWKFTATLQYKLDGARFSTSVTLKNVDTEEMPAGFGHHPFYMRTLTSGTDTARLEIPCSKFFVVENMMPTAGPIPVEPRVDFQKLRPLGTEFIDDCLTGRAYEKPIRFLYTESGIEIDMMADRIFENIVYYLPNEKPYFAVEPVTNANDGFNLYNKGIPGSSVFILKPGEEKQGAYSFEVRQNGQ